MTALQGPAGWLALFTVLLVVASAGIFLLRYRARRNAIRTYLAHAAAEPLRVALGANGLGVFDYHLSSGECHVNPVYAGILGYDPDTFRETVEAWQERLHPDDSAEAMSVIAACLRGDVAEFSVEFRQRHATGEWKRILSQGAVVERLSDGTPLRLVGTWTDSTERERANAAGRDRDERYRSQRDALVLIARDESAATEALDAALVRITRLSAETLRVARVSIWLYDSTGDSLECRALYDVRTGPVEPGTVLLRSDYPTYFQSLSEWTVIAADDAHGDVRTSEFSESYLGPLGITSMMDASIHLGGAVVGVLCHEHTGPARPWTEDEKTFAVAVAALVALALEGEQRRRKEVELRQQRDLLHRAHQALNSHLLNSPLAVVEWDREHRVTHWSTRAQAIFGFSPEEVLGRRPDEWRFVHEDDLPLVRLRMADASSGTPSSQGTNRNYTRDGAILHCEWYTSVLVDESGQVSSLFSLVHDVTERVRAEEEQRVIEARLLQSQKLETVGRLAGGIAHDFNNLLTVINGTADMALQGHANSREVREDLRQIRDAGERAATLTRQLLAFSRKQILQPGVVAVNQLVENLHGMMRRLIGEHIALVLELDPDAGNVVADAGQLEQVVLNLVVNARDAMPTGGTLSIRTGSVTLLAGDPRLPVGMQAGTQMLISVSDTGVGMDDATRLRVFEPFYTTKEPEKGTGLGLAMVHGIVLQTGGAIWVDSTPGHGSTFSVCLPRTLEVVPEQPASAPAGRPGGAGTVLVVEDEPALRTLAVRILRGAGYHVLAAGDGLDALALLRESAAAVDLMLTDVVMPGMSGRELADHVAVEFPGVRVLFTSGYTDDEILRHGVLDNAADFIPKPYTIDALVSRVQSMLDSTTGFPHATTGSPG